MKSPRHLLFSRHDSAARKLDSFRKDLVDLAVQERREAAGRSPQVALARPGESTRTSGWLGLLRVWGQSLRVSRVNAACLAAIWLVILILKVVTPGATIPRMVLRMNEEQRMAMLERRRWLIELTDTPPPVISPMKNPATRPRSEGLSGSAVA